jgi:hypothetical protein
VFDVENKETLSLLNMFKLLDTAVKKIKGSKKCLYALSVERCFENSSICFEPLTSNRTAHFGVTQK